MPGSPRTTSAPLPPDRTVSSSVPTTASSASRPYSMAETVPTPTDTGTDA
jgi:hypothetical protein